MVFLQRRRRGALSCISDLRVHIVSALTLASTVGCVQSTGVLAIQSKELAKQRTVAFVRNCER
jgi:hypothetical protein